MGARRKDRELSLQGGPKGLGFVSQFGFFFLTNMFA
jgi:hypothetical protein